MSHSSNYQCVVGGCNASFASQGGLALHVPRDFSQQNSSKIIAKRKEDSGKIKLLLHWTPEDILPDVWVNENERQQLKTKLYIYQSSQDTALLLDPNIYRNSSKRIAHSGTLKDHIS
ncbi:hypothetical protein GDO86_004913 [Hymenochirus boettgeri]|uniref:AEBP2-like C-terminal SH3 domain-containing protein n=1 Tax=Hymenochirus boettgeri TaxID=247094 RepID=A0A8T2J509_9PIPI|nr:hypothetical protein GDO86_004913 [Hymenochirus boettgeri]